MPPGLARALYTLLLFLLSPLIWRRVWREWAPTNPRRERLGLIAEADDPRPCLWLHAASLGEVATATSLIEALLADHPDHRLVITTMTATGAERVRERFGERVRHYFLPLDFPGATRRFVTRLAPALAVIAETELWPNLLAACRQRGVPVAIVNARLSDGAFSLYQRFRPLTAGMLADVAWVGAKSPSDAERFIALGTPAEAVTMTGALKFDLAVSDEAKRNSERLRRRWGARPVWIAGSTQPGEDAQILAAHAALKARFPEALLILVPRHPQRFDEVAALCQASGEAVVRRSEMRRGEAYRDESHEITVGTTVLLGDTMGELTTLYGAADIAFVGGSLVPIGGHNLLEPAALGVPVLSGPHLDNLREIADALAANDARLEVANADALGRALIALFEDDARRHRLGEAGRGVVEANRGALAVTRERIAFLLPSPVSR
ncbi:lipid IV(A) 3-deoxy-D-manno-octulosonic acid transferase [Salinicola halophilus]|uniref:lipid IV(A) 3-deoxy-D-manno-octulosonic acid transferase n=1 Tax=Salinicola halophilus TaxID=184065 RepID=UPI000DA21274|nr:lipid IV(A) 3-deoxy-D-manno-octulosonic acid transferase [Salinicola halophilus]